VVNIPSIGDVLAAFFAARPQAGDGGVYCDSRDRIEPEPDPDEPVPFTLTGQAEAALDAAEPEAATAIDVLAVFTGELAGPEADAVLASYFAPGPEPRYDTPEARAEAAEPEAEP
jgi:hypothetical protein